jgi:hypothetical protein
MMDELETIYKEISKFPLKDLLAFQCLLSVSIAEKYNQERGDDESA